MPQQDAIQLELTMMVRYLETNKDDSRPSAIALVSLGSISFMPRSHCDFEVNFYIFSTGLRWAQHRYEFISCQAKTSIPMLLSFEA